MPSPERKKLFPNPFYLALVVMSTVFVATALGYWIGPFFEQGRIDHPDARVAPASLALLDWIDRHGPIALGVEFVLMTVLALMAMAADDFFTPKAKKPAPAPAPAPAREGARVEDPSDAVPSP